MKMRFVFTVFFLLAGLLLALGYVGLARAQEPLPEAPQGALSPEAPDEFTNLIPIQGYLTDAAGNPLNGNYAITLRLYETPDGADVLCEATFSDVVINQGLFTISVNLKFCTLDSRTLYLGVQVEDDPEMTPRQKIENVPSAWTLHPGAVISNTVLFRPMLTIQNWSTTGAGLFVNALDNSPDIILGGNAATVDGDNGVLASDPDFPSSDIVLRSNDTVLIDLNDDGDGESSQLLVRDKDNNPIFNLNDSGDMTYGGLGVAAYPRPAYDSGWVSIAKGESIELTHGLGGDANNYVVELTFTAYLQGISQKGFGGNGTTGGYWHKLNNDKITIVRLADEPLGQMRVRIWMYP